jgi:selenoprotein W-related protein
MSEIEIEYCVPCGMRDRAVDLQEEILGTFGQEIDRVALKTGDSGVFEVRFDGYLVFDKDEEEYDVDAIVEALSERHAAAA